MAKTSIQMSILSDTISDILEKSPGVSFFAVASDDLARRNAGLIAKKDTKASRKKSKTKARRKKGADKLFLLWKEAVDDIFNNTLDKTTGEIVSSIESLPLDAIRIATTSTDAELVIDQMALDIRQLQNGIGIWEQFVTEDIIFIWLWNDV